MSAVNDIDIEGYPSPYYTHLSDLIQDNSWYSYHIIPQTLIHMSNSNKIVPTLPYVIIVSHHNSYITWVL